MEPAAQGMQLLAPVSSWYLPAEHCMHVPLPFLLNVPFAQALHRNAPLMVDTEPARQGIHLVAPVALCEVPGLHKLQTDAPEKEEYDPGLQLEHVAAPDLPENCPLGQDKHLALPAGAYLPDAHGRHGPAREGTAPAGQADPHPPAPVVVDTEPGVPSAQAWHFMEAALAANVVGAHGTQAVPPTDAVKVPGLHGVQRELALFENVPAGHCRQARPLTEKNPGLQGWQALSPAVLASNPGKLRVQTVLPLAPWK